MKLRFLVVLCCTLCALTVGATTAGAGDGGSSDAAKACQKGGWENLLGADGLEFNNQGECVSYVSQGGTLMTHFQRACADFGATWFPSTIFASGTCEPVAPNLAPFLDPCVADGYDGARWVAVGDEQPPIGYVHCIDV